MSLGCSKYNGYNRKYFFSKYLSVYFIPSQHSTHQRGLTGLQCCKELLWNQCIGEIYFVFLAHWLPSKSLGAASKQAVFAIHENYQGMVRNKKVSCHGIPQSWKIITLATLSALPLPVIIIFSTFGITMAQWGKILIPSNIYPSQVVIGSVTIFLPVCYQAIRY